LRAWRRCSSSTAATRSLVERKLRDVRERLGDLRRNEVAHESARWGLCLGCAVNWLTGYAVPIVYSALVMRACAIVVLLTVTVSALWCVDGCVDPLATRTGQSSAHMPDEDESRLPCLCVVPFQTEPLGPAGPFWRALVADQAFALPDVPSGPSFDIDHPPRTA